MPVVERRRVLSAVVGSMVGCLILVAVQRVVDYRG